MHFRSILSGTLALLVSGGLAFAGNSAPSRAGGVPAPVPAVGLPGVFGAEAGEETIILAQAGDPRITALEEQVRQLSGTIEELNFQILQMQEQMRKMQEDNEFRFQELEKKSDAGAGGNNVAATAQPPANSSGSGAQPGTAATTPTEPRAGDVATAPDGQGTGAPPREFGTITFDAQGNVKSGVAADTTADGAASDGTTVAALPSTDDPEELYRNSYEFILSGDYPTAEAGFRDHIQRFPADQKTADARFWLGESLLGQQKYRDAAETFLAANKDYPDSKKAPDMLLKLGVSLVGLNQKDVACATFGEVVRKYPNASGALKERVKQEQALAAC